MQSGERDMTDKQPLLSIAIPTWNRSFFLEKILKQLQQELVYCEPENVEILVSDNFSSDNTEEIVDQAKISGLKLNYIRNEENIGSDANIAQCFNLARGKYVLILGDDDLFVDKALAWLLERLRTEKYGVVCMRPYGFDKDFRQEYPGEGGSEKAFLDVGLFLAAIGSLMTLISSCVIHKSILPEVDARYFCGENLVQVHLVIRAALKSPENLFANRYLIACKRNNTGGYDFSKVFVENLGRIFDSYKDLGLTTKTVASIERRMLIGHFPYYLFRQRLTNEGDVMTTYHRFLNRYKGQWCFYIWDAPILKLPRFLALIWGGSATIIGRILNGDLQRGIMFMVSKLVQIS
jgi:abequosyltransferase